MHTVPWLESITSALAILIILFVIINLIMLFQRISLGVERRNKNLTILTSLGLIALAISTVLERSGTRATLGEEAEIAHELLEASALLIFAAAFFFNIEKGAREISEEKTIRQQKSKTKVKTK